MMNSYRFLFLLLSLGLFATAGCADGQPPNPSNSPPAFVDSTQSRSVANAEPPADPMIEITPAALSRFRSIGEKAYPNERWRVRLMVVPGGCSGMYHKLDMESGPVLPQDATQQCGNVEVVYSKEQFPAIQGTLIDWVKTEKETGFTIKSPKQTQENKEKTSKWINAEIDKRLKKIRADIDERITQYRNLVADDTDNELAHSRLAQLLKDDGRLVEAVKSFERVLTIAPNNPKSYQLLGECLIELDQKDRAAEVLKKGRAIAQKQGNETVCTEIGELLAQVNATPRKNK